MFAIVVFVPKPKKTYSSVRIVRVSICVGKLMKENS